MDKRINLVSDTVTRPSAAMLEYMMKAEVGDDVFRQDPSANMLEEKLAKMFNMEAALFTPSGTMANQIAIRLHTKPSQQVICDKTAHIYVYENGGIAANSHCSVKPLNGDRGRFKLEDVREALQINGPYYMQETGLVSVENTTNLGGGATWDIEELKKISALCRENNIPFHLDGARLFNALVANNQKPSQYGEIFDTISVCISKGLGAPVGSVLLGSKKHIEKAIRIRKMMGGGMRQIGYLAAACIYALDNNVDRLADDHRRAKMIGDLLKSKKYVKEILPVETNIVRFQIDETVMKQSQFLEVLHKNKIDIVNMGGPNLRITLHLDVSEDDVSKVLEVLDSM